MLDIRSSTHMLLTTLLFLILLRHVWGKDRLRFALEDFKTPDRTARSLSRAVEASRGCFEQPHCSACVGSPQGCAWSFINAVCEPAPVALGLTLYIDTNSKCVGCAYTDFMCDSRISRGIRDAAGSR